jgi:hypothetical protein
MRRSFVWMQVWGSNYKYYFTIETATKLKLARDPIEMQDRSITTFKQSSVSEIVR